MMDRDYHRENNDEIFDSVIEKYDILAAPSVNRLTMMYEFFRPDPNYINWLREYIGDRIVIDVGCGAGHITQRLQDAGARTVGIDPYLDLTNLMDLRMSAMNKGKESPHYLPWRIDEAKGLFQTLGNRVVLMYCRPCHSDFVREGIELMDDETECLYITKPSVLVNYDDLGEYIDYAVKIPHKGTSVDKEEVWSIRKNILIQ